MADIRSAVNDLARQLSGYICEPGSAEYTKVVDIDNGRTRTPPAYVVRAKSFQDVTRAIGFAQKTGLPMTVRGGGHSTAVGRPRTPTRWPPTATSAMTSIRTSLTGR